MTEEEIAALFDQVARDLDFPGIEAVVTKAERDGRRQRHRHRALLATSSALTVGAIVVVTSSTGVVPGLTRTLGFTPSAAGASPTASASASAVSPSTGPSPASSAATPGPTETPSPGSGTTGGMTTTQIMDELQALLPAGSTIADVRSDAGEGKSVEFDYNDGQGAVDFMFSIEPTSFYQRPLTCSQSPWSGTTDEGPRPAGALPQSCVMTTLPDGSILQDWVTYADSYSFYGYNITDQRPDGTVVWVQVANGINHTLPQVDRAVPPGSFAEWNSLVENPIWHL